jgi:RNA polymerase sigma factor (sigma-70 family)
MPTPTLTYREITCTFVAAQPTLERVVFNRVNCRETARNIAQDLFFRLDRLADRFASEEDARRFLVRMAINAAKDHRRVECRRLELLEQAGPVLTAEVMSDPTTEGGLMEDVEAALAELPSKCRDVLFLSRVEGLTHAEIAMRLGVSRSLVEKYAVRALLHCRARMTGVSSQV